MENESLKALLVEAGIPAWAISTNSDGELYIDYTDLETYGDSAKELIMAQDLIHTDKSLIITAKA